MINISDYALIFIEEMYDTKFNKHPNLNPWDGFDIRNLWMLKLSMES